MSIFSESVAEMTEHQRFSYLQAMGITCWIPKHSEVELAVEFESTHEDSGEKPVKLEVSAKQEITNSLKAKANQEKSNNHSIEIKDKTNEELVQASIPKVTQSEDENKSDVLFSVNQYLKVLDWSDQSLVEEGAKNLLIVCRHQVDQPANSFARNNSPSLFMTDYINAIKANLGQSDINLNIKMAHMTEAGLSDSCVRMRDVLQQSQPDLVLIMGDETVSQLAGEDIGVAPLRGQSFQLGLQHTALVSYHPYTLIENASLKPLAMEDISMIGKFLSQQKN